MQITIFTTCATLETLTALGIFAKIQGGALDFYLDCLDFPRFLGATWPDSISYGFGINRNLESDAFFGFLGSKIGGLPSLSFGSWLGTLHTVLTKGIPS